MAELRYGALVAEWGAVRRCRLEAAIATTTMIRVTDELLSTVAQLRFECSPVGHPLADRAHHEDLWIAATAVHVEAQLMTADGVFDGVPGLALV